MRWRKTATLFLSCLLASALPAEAAKKEKLKHPPSTEDERREMVDMARYLENNPLAEDAQFIRTTVVTFFRDVPDIKIKVCNMVPELLHGKKNNFNIILFTQGVVSKSAFVAANPELAHDTLLANMAGLVGILRAYQAVLEDNTAARRPELDTLLKQSPTGELPAFVTERTMECEEDLVPDDEGKTDKAEAAADHLRYGNKFFDQGDYQLALIEYTRAGRLAPDQANAYELSQLYYSLGNLEKAKTYGEESVQRDPKCSLCYQGLGNIYDDSHRPHDAIGAYRKAIELTPENGHLLYNYAVTLDELEKRTDAIAALRTAVKVEPSYASSHRLLGTFLAANSEFYEADTEFHQFLRLEPPGERYDQVLEWLKPTVHLDPTQIRPRSPQVQAYSAYGLTRMRWVLTEFKKNNPSESVYKRTAEEELAALATEAEFWQMNKTAVAYQPLDRLLEFQRNGFLEAYVYTCDGDRFPQEHDRWTAAHPTGIADFKRWTEAHWLSTECTHQPVSIEWMGQVLLSD